MRLVLATALASSLTFSGLAVSALYAQAPPTPAVSAFAPPAQGETKFQGKRLLVLYFDMAGLPIAEQQRAQQAALTYINTQLSGMDMVAVMNHTTDVNILQDFSNNRETLVAAINKMTPGAAVSGDQSESTDRKLTALQQAVKLLGVFPEKKALVYFAGATKTGTDNQAQLSATINAALKNNVAFYPVDASGLLAPVPAGTN